MELTLYFIPFIPIAFQWTSEHPLAPHLYLSLSVSVHYGCTAMGKLHLHVCTSHNTGKSFSLTPHCLSTPHTRSQTHNADNMTQSLNRVYFSTAPNEHVCQTNAREKTTGREQRRTKEKRRNKIGGCKSELESRVLCPFCSGTVKYEYPW